ncbi:MAG: CC0125/CC1285 family lipoprotein [Alphaproteobacteria bacterium]
MTDRRLIHKFTAILAVAALTACTAAGPTLYRAMSGGFGYSEAELDNGAWRVEFTGNQASGPADVENYALYRSAEIARQGGFERFAVMERDIGRQVRRSQGFEHRPPGFDSRERRHDATLQAADPFIDNRMVSTITNQATLIIRPYTGIAPRGRAHTYSVREVLVRFGPKIRRRR